MWGDTLGPGDEQLMETQQDLMQEFKYVKHTDTSLQTKTTTQVKHINSFRDATFCKVYPLLMTFLNTLLLEEKQPIIRE